MGAAIDRPSNWQTGLATTIEGATAIRGGAMHGRTLQAQALANLEWAQPGLPRGESGLRAHASVLGLTGRGPTERFAGDLLALSNIEGHRSLRLYSWWFQGDAGAWQWRIGSLLADEEFAGTETGSHFANSAFGWPTFISANTVNTGPAFYAAAAGLRVRQATDASAYWQAGVYDGDSFDSSTGDASINEHGLRPRLNAQQGWFAMIERGWTPPESPTRWKVGAWFHSARVADTLADESGRSAALTGESPRSHPHNFGGYGCMEHTLLGRGNEPGQVEVFLRAGLAPGDRNPIGWALDTGVAVLGPLPGRTKDVAALGFARGTFSRDYRTSLHDAAPRVATPDFEEVVELSYALEAGAHTTLRPSLQYLRHPGGSPERSDALVGLLRLEAKY